jgi:exopolysaccharide biosynthesis protein
MKKIILILLVVINSGVCNAQLNWQNVDSDYLPLLKNMHVYKCTDSIDSKPFIAYYASIKLKEKSVKFTTDTSLNRRLTPEQFYAKNNNPALVVNGTFFSFATNKNLNTVIKNRKLLSYNVHTIAGKQKDTLTYKHIFASAIGISKKRKADIAWLYSDSSKNKAFALQLAASVIKDSSKNFSFSDADLQTTIINGHNGYIYNQLKKWKMNTAIGGGPVLVQQGEIKISNNEELKFAGKAIDDKHPRTCMGYTFDGRLIILVIQGRSADAAGATLTQAATILQNLGCNEALNLDGGGSSCMLINGKETIKPSDKEGQRAVPAVFIVK